MTATTTRLGLERAIAISAVAGASRACREVRAGFVPAKAMSKADRSPVTVADLAVQALVSMLLAESFPDDGIMGEEDSTPLRAAPDLADAVLERVAAHRPGVSMADIAHALDRCDDAGGPARRWWTLDPVDGTKGFLRDEQYAVALALVEDGEVVLAVMGSPNLPVSGLDRTRGPVGCIFVAVRGEGARQVALDAIATQGADDVPGGGAPDGVPIAVAAIPDIAEARYAESVEAGHSSQSGARRIADRLGISAEPVRLDSQTKYAVVARGDASIYLRLPHGGYRENVWDHAAGALIVTEAGGRVSDADGLPLDFTRGRLLTVNRGIVACAPSIHARVIDAVAAAFG